MCGAEMICESGELVALCRACGAHQTMPVPADEKQAQMYFKANELRRSRQFEKAQGVYELLLADNPADVEANWGKALCAFGVTYVKDPITRKFTPNVYLPQETSFLEDENARAALENAEGEQKALLEHEASKVESARLQILQVRARQKADEEHRRKIRNRYLMVFKVIVAALLLYLGYLVVNKYVIVPNIRYQQAVAYQEEGDLMRAHDVFASLNGFRDSRERAVQILNEINYAAASDYELSGRHDKASEGFFALGDYLDSAQRATQNLYLAGVTWQENRDGQKAWNAFETLGDYEDSAQRLSALSGQYDEAVALEEAGDIAAAVDIYRTLGDLNDCRDRFTAIVLKDASFLKPNDVLYFGSYEQDGDKSNGPERIEWRVLDPQDGKVLLLSRYGLETRCFSPGYVPSLWSQSEIRTWLNSDFRAAAFTEEEQAQVLLTDVQNIKATAYYTSDAGATQDYIFLLSSQEAEQYLPERLDKTCVATPYALSHGAYVNVYDGNSNWWLRTRGANEFNTAYVFTEGVVFNHGFHASHSQYVIRPAFWLQIGE